MQSDVENPCPQVCREIDSLENICFFIGERVCDLEERLGSVLRLSDEETAVPSGTELKKPLVPLADRLSNIKATANVAFRKLSSILDRLEL